MRKFVLAIGSLIVHKLRWKAMLGYIGRAWVVCVCMHVPVRLYADAFGICVRSLRYCGDTRYVESIPLLCLVVESHGDSGEE